MFCPERYALSHYLPGAVQLLADPNRYVWEGIHGRNWLHRADIILPAVTGDAVVYQVFFTVKKAPRAAAFDLEMVVESAYAFDPLRLPKTSGRMKIVGQGICDDKKLPSSQYSWLKLNQCRLTAVSARGHDVSPETLMLTLVDDF